MKTKNSGWRSIRTDARTSSPTKNTSIRSAVLDARGRPPACTRRTATRPPRAAIARVVSLPGEVSVAGREAEDGREARAGHTRPSRASRRRTAPSCGLVDSSWPNATPPGRLGPTCRRTRHSHRNTRTATAPTTSVTSAMPTQRHACGAVPSHASWRPWTPGGVKSPIRTRMSGSRHARQVHPAQEHHGEEHRDRDRRRHASRRRPAQQQPDREQRAIPSANARRYPSGLAGTGTPKAR